MSDEEYIIKRLTDIADKLESRARAPQSEVERSQADRLLGIVKLLREVTRLGMTMIPAAGGA